MAARKLRKKNMHVRLKTSGSLGPPSTSPRYQSTFMERASMVAPSRYCTGTSQVFLRPKEDTKQESTTGAHSSLMENGQYAKENSACRNRKFRSDSLPFLRDRLSSPAPCTRRACL